MLTPEAKRLNYARLDMLDVMCPTQENPFIRTKRNWQNKESLCRAVSLNINFGIKLTVDGNSNWFTVVLVQANLVVYKPGKLKKIW